MMGRKFLFSIGLVFIISGLLRNTWEMPTILLFFFTSLALMISLNDFFKSMYLVIKKKDEHLGKVSVFQKLSNLAQKIFPYLVFIVPTYSTYWNFRYNYIDSDLSRLNDMMTLLALGASIIAINWTNNDSN
ncbi:MULTISPECIES: hypothetical protein [Bacillus cereus group]|uniref:hypothetical protein n=1 Tax=Bacillus cereus group TaxID=86661 RepID=UPI00111D6161|nr:MULTISPECIES: hypothetical protein [Bacillus cereus group]MED0972215.1 hypothetical protein [Bacillus paramycoides]TNP14902.1 hypothetical protein FHY73_22155 [Bacillus tropicus]